jgi:hypothetical protein
MTIAASNNVPQLLTQLVEEGTLKAEHRKMILAAHQERREALKAKYNGKIWNASSQERHDILSGQVALSFTKELGGDLAPEVIRQALHRQQLARVKAAKKDVIAAIDGDAPRFEFWVANLRQSMYEKPNHSDRMVAIGDLAREIAVLAVHNPKVQTTLLVHLGTLREVLEKIHFHEDEAIIKKELHGVLDNLIQLSNEGHIDCLEVYNEQGHKVTMKQDDLIQFVNDTRFLVTG